MKKFDMDKALKGDKVVTRKGEEVKQFTWFDCKRKGVVGVVDDELFTWFEDGRFLEDEDSIFDLFMASTKHEGWINLYSCGEAGIIYDTEEEALGQAEGGCLATVKVEWEV